MSRRRTRKQTTSAAPRNPLPTLTPVSDAAYDAAVEVGQPTRTTDAYSNSLARLGAGTNNLTQGTSYTKTNLTKNYSTLNNLYRENWIVQRIINTYPEDMLRAWIRVISQVDPEALDRFASVARHANLRQRLASGLRWGRLYGGAGGLILIDGHNNLSEPLDLSTVLPDSFKGLHIIDRWSGIFPSADLVTDIGSPDFGLPQTYQVRDGSGRTITNVHHSRIVRFTGAPLPYLEQLAEQSWGASVIEALYEEVVARDNVKANITSLTFRANISAMEIDGLDQMLGAGNAQAAARFWNMMQQQSIFMSNMGVQLLNRGDKFQTHQYTFAGLADIYAAVQADISGATGIPVTKLFGRSPGGLNATGEHDMENYYDQVEQQQEEHLRPALDKLLPIVAMSAWGEIPDDFRWDFNPIRTPKTSDLAAIIKAKVAAILDAFDKGLLDQAAAMKELRQLADETGLYSNVTDAMIEAGAGRWVWQLGALADPFAGIRPTRPNPSDGDNVFAE